MRDEVLFILRSIHIYLWFICMLDSALRYICGLYVCFSSIGISNGAIRTPVEVPHARPARLRKSSCTQPPPQWQQQPGMHGVDQAPLMSVVVAQLRQRLGCKLRCLGSPFLPALARADTFAFPTILVVAIKTPGAGGLKHVRARCVACVSLAPVVCERRKHGTQIY
jgi:hypothetical protein